MVAQEVLPHEERILCSPQDLAPSLNATEDLVCIASNLRYLQTSGWYWGSISASEAREALLTMSEGTFLVRDSSHPQYMLALSVKTRYGPTSVRIEYNWGSFWLNSISPGVPDLQSFPDVPSLIQHYTAPGRTPQDSIRPTTDSNSSQLATKDKGILLRLRRPLLRPLAFPSLQHLTRLTINRNTNCFDHLPLPKPLLGYLQSYPFHL
ncbi:cytokine-inducible SH2-containing protein-like [Neosynchiropus ocellatus]